MTKRLVLVGAGHAHLHLLKHVAVLKECGAEVTVVAPEDFWYSGMATGMLAGLFPPEQDRVDVAALLAGAGVTLKRSAMRGLDHEAREIELADGERLPFDLVSLNVGSAPPPLPGDQDAIHPAKPVRALVALRDCIEAAWRRSDRKMLRIAVIGGGTTGIEIAANLRAFAEWNRRPMAITVYSKSRPLGDLPAGAASAVLRHLQRHDVDVRSPAAVASVARGAIMLEDGASQECDLVVNAAGLKPSPVLAHLGLPTATDGSLIIDRFLRSTGDAAVFAVGDCAAFEGRPLPRVGVYAVRQAPVLLANLAAALRGAPLAPFVPQRRYLSIVGLGRSSALMVRDGAWFKGPPALWLKRWIDQRFVDRYR